MEIGTHKSLSDKNTQNDWINAARDSVQEIYDFATKDLEMSHEQAIAYVRQNSCASMKIINEICVDINLIKA